MNTTRVANSPKDAKLFSQYTLISRTTTLGQAMPVLYSLLEPYYVHSLKVTDRRYAGYGMPRGF